MPSAVQIVEPLRATAPVVFASPHSGRVYPADFLARAQVPELALRSSEDAFIDALIVDAPSFGAPLVTSQVPRAYVDFNRAADELDPALIEGAPLTMQLECRAPLRFEPYYRCGGRVHGAWRLTWLSLAPTP